MTISSAQAARELESWFQSVSRLANQGLFEITPEGKHREVLVLDVLRWNARLVVDAQIDHAGLLYTPVCLVLVAASKKLKVVLRAGHWRAAVDGVLQARAQSAAATKAEIAALDLGSSAVVFLNEFKEALRQSGATGVPTALDAENQRIALGLSINWGIRFLLAYALESDVRNDPPERRGLGWMADLLKEVSATAS